MRLRHLGAKHCLRNSPFSLGASVFLSLLLNSSQPIQLPLLGLQIPGRKEGAGGTVFQGDQDANPLYAQRTQTWDVVGMLLRINLNTPGPSFPAHKVHFPALLFP